MGANERRNIIDSDDEDIPLALLQKRKLESVQISKKARQNESEVLQSANGIVDSVRTQEEKSITLAENVRDNVVVKTEKVEEKVTVKHEVTEKETKIISDSDDDVPLSVLKAQISKKVKKESYKRKAEKEDKTKKDKVKKEHKIKKEKKIKQEFVKVKKETSTNETIKKSKTATKVKTETAVKIESDGPEKVKEEIPHFKWWEKDHPEDDTIKWHTLEHSGVLFPPEYVPHNIKMKYDGKPIDLPADAEEVASFYAAIIGTPTLENPIFRSNFFADFREVLPQNLREKIIDLDKCDFSDITTYLNALKDQKKQMTKEEKKALREAKAEAEAKYEYCLLNGRKEKVGNFRIEPPGLFRGRGEHPKTGKLKQRVLPEQVTINIGQESPIPEPPKGHQWKAVVHDPTVTWLATWNENINNATKYVFLAAGSSLKGKSDLKKFETARELKKHVDKIRKRNKTELTAKEMLVRQRATALWLIDHLALRAGNAKGEDEADTVGCCSLRCEHVTLQEPSTLIFDFLGKDSIRYYNEVEVDLQIFKNFSIFMRPPKTGSDLIFDRLTTSTLNKFLTEMMPGLTAKVFRTYNASHTFQKELENTGYEHTDPEKILSYNRANRQVAILCNHQRSVPKTHGSSMEKLRNKILEAKYKRLLIKQSMNELLSGKKLELDESDLDEEKILEFQEADEQKPMNNPSIEKLEKKLHNVNQRIEKMKNQLIDRDEGKTTALGTSKLNYIDPRISAAWCKKHDVPLEKIFNKTLRDKFKWALEVDKDWEF